MSKTFEIDLDQLPDSETGTWEACEKKSNIKALGVSQREAFTNLCNELLKTIPESINEESARIKAIFHMLNVDFSGQAKEYVKTLNLALPEDRKKYVDFMNKLLEE